MQINFHISPDVRENIRHSFPMLSLSLNLHNYPNIYLSILFLLLQFSMIVSIYLLYTVLWFIQTVFLHVFNMLFGLMTIRLNKCYYYNTTAATTTTRELNAKQVLYIRCVSLAEANHLDCCLHHRRVTWRRNLISLMFYFCVYWGVKDFAAVNTWRTKY